MNKWSAFFEKNTFQVFPAANIGIIPFWEAKLLSDFFFEKIQEHVK